MIKFGFRLVADETALWARILREKYKIDTSCPITISRKDSSFLWRSLNKVWHHVYNGISWSIGDGGRTKFWLDIWIPELGPLFGHKVDNSVVDVDILVCQMADGVGNWLWDEFRHLITDEAATKMACINAPIYDAGRDLCIWRWADNGKFSVSTAYETLCKHQWETKDDKWVAIWSYRGPQRVRQFLWLVVKHRILTNVERCRRHMADNACCSLCGYNQEHIDHVLRSCPAAMAIWSKLIAPSQWTMFFSTPLDVWILENLSNNCIVDGYAWSTFFGILCWRIWKNRNLQVFNDESPSAAATVVHCRAWSRTMKQNEMKRKRGTTKAWKQVGWELPSSGRWKLNTDGAMKGSSRVASAGGIIRNDEGLWIHRYSRSIGAATVIQAELWAVLDGLKLAWERGIRALDVESDNSTIVHMLNSDRLEGSNYSLVRHIWALMDRQWEVSVKHIYREANTAADFLANWSSGMPPELHTFDSPPRGLLNILLLDKLGNSQRRLCPV